MIIDSNIYILNTVTNSNATATTATTETLAANDKRTYALIVNDSDVVIYLALGADAVLNKGIRLNATGGSYEINNDNKFYGAVNAIHGGSGDKNICTVESV